MSAFWYEFFSDFPVFVIPGVAIILWLSHSAARRAHLEEKAAEQERNREAALTLARTSPSFSSSSFSESMERLAHDWGMSSVQLTAECLHSGKVAVHSSVDPALLLAYWCPDCGTTSYMPWNG